MTGDAHQRARSLIALAQTLSVADQAWLERHLEDCDSCNAHAVEVREVIHALRSLPVAASSSLVETTRLLVRLRARELQLRQDRLQLVWVCCVLVTASAGLTTILAWRGWEWLGRQLQVSSLVWQVSFVVLWITPVLIAGLLLLANGTYLRDRGGAWQG